MISAEQLMSDGYQEGISQGISQGINQGINRGKTEIAINLLRQGLDIKVIVKSTGLSIA